MNVTICAPGIEIGITDASKLDIAHEAVASLMYGIFYGDELQKEVITVHKEHNTTMEVVLRLKPDNELLKGFSVSNKWFCLPDAVDVVINWIAES